MDINEITTFFGWCTVVNIAIYTLSAVFIFVFKNFTISIHSKLAGINTAELPKMYFNYLANYKIAILIFSFSPYLALRLMA